MLKLEYLSRHLLSTSYLHFIFSIFPFLHSKRLADLYSFLMPALYLFLYTRAGEDMKLTTYLTTRKCKKWGRVRLTKIMPCRDNQKVRLIQYVVSLLFCHCILKIQSRSRYKLYGLNTRKVQNDSDKIEQSCLRSEPFELMFSTNDTPVFSNFFLLGKRLHFKLRFHSSENVYVSFKSLKCFSAAKTIHTLLLVFSGSQ